MHFASISPKLVLKISQNASSAFPFAFKNNRVFLSPSSSTKYRYVSIEAFLAEVQDEEIDYRYSPKDLEEFLTCYAKFDDILVDAEKDSGDMADTATDETVDDVMRTWEKLEELAKREGIERLPERTARYAHAKENLRRFQYDQQDKLLAHLQKSPPDGIESIKRLFEKMYLLGFPVTYSMGKSPQERLKHDGKEIYTLKEIRAKQTWFHTYLDGITKQAEELLTQSGEAQENTGGIEQNG